jgi:hypothetical protein
VPDIQSALQAALAKTVNAWAEDDEAHQTIEPKKEKAMKDLPAPQDSRITNNVCRTTFDFVRDNPGMTRTEVTKELAKKDFNPGSVSSLLGQMIKQGMMRESAHLLYVTINEYTPIKNAKKKKYAKTEKTTKVSNAAPKVLYTQAIYQPVPEQAAVPEWTPSGVIDKLNVRQALALYAELRNIFGA